MKFDPPPEFVHDIAHLMRALEKEGLAEFEDWTGWPTPVSHHSEVHQESFRAGR